MLKWRGYKNTPKTDKRDEIMEEKLFRGKHFLSSSFPHKTTLGHPFIY